MAKVIGAFLFLKARLSEPSSLASLSAIMAMIGVNVDSSVIQDGLNVGTLVFGALGFFVAEASPLTKVD
jgi:hypothetical protein